MYLFDTDSDSTPFLEPNPLLSAQRRGRPLVSYDQHAPVVAPLRSFSGHRNKETVKDVAFCFDESYIASGSDDGNLFIWDKSTGAVRGIFQGDGSVVNAIQMHPSFPILAISGIDPTIKILSPTSASIDLLPSSSPIDATRTGQNLVDDQDGIIQRNQGYRQDDTNMGLSSSDVSHLHLLWTRGRIDNG